MTAREHGTLAMRTRGDCQTDPCPPCLEAGRRYERRRRTMRELGHAAYVDAGPVREHTRRLLAWGMTVHQIQEASGVNRTSIRVMLGDFPNRPASKQVRARTAAALLHVRLNLGDPVGGATVDAAGTRRRIQALQAHGYPRVYLAQRLGNSRATVLQVAAVSRVRASTARAVAALYAELEYIPGPSHRTATRAAMMGFLGPSWWDADTIDDPRAEPAGLRSYTEGGVLLDDVSAPRSARIDLLKRRGLSNPDIAARLGVPLRYVLRDQLGRGQDAAS